MDAVTIFGGGAVITALGMGFFAADTWLRGRKGGAAVLQQRRDLWWKFRNGVPLLYPLAERTLRLSPLQAAAEELRLTMAHHGVTTSTVACGSLFWAAAIAAGLLVALWGGGLVGALAAALAVMVGLVSFLKAAASKREQALREEIPDALRAMGTCFTAGLSLQQTLRQTGDELDGRLKELFLQAVHKLDTGASIPEALATFQQRTSLPELSFVAVALDVQHQSGGSVASVLDSAREAVEGELALQRSLRVQTAQAKLSARVVTLLPFVLIALFSLVSKDFLAPFFSSVAGLALLGLALLMQVGGVVLIRRLLRTQGG